jgi:hypothetical protein
LLANNAGGLVDTRGLTRDVGLKHVQHNHLAPFLLTNLLLLLDRVTGAPAG